MATQDKSVVLKWDQAVVVQIAIIPQPNNRITIQVAGTTKDSNGNLVNLAVATLDIAAGQVSAVDNMLARALIELRKANGLET